jgi:hypothetical protein
MDLKFMESVWWVFKELYCKGAGLRGVQGDALLHEAGDAFVEFRGEFKLPGGR